MGETLWSIALSVFMLQALAALAIVEFEPPPCSLDIVKTPSGNFILKLASTSQNGSESLCTLPSSSWKQIKLANDDSDKPGLSQPIQAIAASDLHNTGPAAVPRFSHHGTPSDVLKRNNLAEKNTLDDSSQSQSDKYRDSLMEQLYLLSKADKSKRFNRRNDVLNTDNGDNMHAEKPRLSPVELSALNSMLEDPSLDIVVDDGDANYLSDESKPLETQVDDVYKYEINDSPASQLKEFEAYDNFNNQKTDLKYTLVNLKTSIGRREIVASSVSDSVDKRNNDWNSFSKSMSKPWIDLSHDLNVNYPNPESKVILDVEGVDVEKNIFGKSNHDGRELIYDDDAESDGIETMDEVVVHGGAEIHDSSHPLVSDDGKFRQKREISNSNPDAAVTSETLKIEFLRVDQADREISMLDNGVPELLAGSKVTIRIFGHGIDEDTLITFTQEQGAHGDLCEFPATGVFEVRKGSLHGESALVDIKLPSGVKHHTFYVCAKHAPKALTDDAARTVSFIHQGSDILLQLSTFDKLLPIWASMIIIGVCLFFSALFSGLNLGLMSLDRTELKILCNTGTDKEKEYARVIQPVRDHGNYLLCSILLGNVAVNSTFTILLDDLTSGLVAIITSTLLIVLLGEITPQAICSRHGLAVGAKTVHITKAVMVITFPLSYPVSRLLDFLLGEEIGNVYNRERLKELVKVTNDINDLDKDEVNIISGALELHKKTVSEVMTKIEDVFMLDYEAVLDFETVSEIMKTGFSRIPVYEGNRTNIVAMLYIKDLVFIDPDDNTPLKTLCQFYQNSCNFLFEDVTLDVIFKQFKEGHKGHMAFVQHVNSEGEGDPFYETIGLVTLEDVIEELIQSEIVDETDVFTDNKSKRRRNRPTNKLQDFGVFAERRENQRIRISPQLTLATFQYLNTSVDPFKPDNVSETILRRLLKQDVIHHIKYRGKERLKTDPALIIYERGKAVDYFVLILEGRVEVTVGCENLVFESGPFTYFGSNALTNNVGFAEVPAPASVHGSLQSINMESMLRNTFVPDYSVRAVTEVFYVKIKRTLYLAAKRATLMQKCAGNRSKGADDSGEQFDDEVEKLLHSLEEEPSPVETVKSPSHNASSHHVSPSGHNGSIKRSQQSLVPATTQLHLEPRSEPVPHESSALLPS